MVTAAQNRGVLVEKNYTLESDRTAYRHVMRNIIGLMITQHQNVKTFSPEA